MRLSISGILNDGELDEIRGILDEAAFRSGAATAGWRGAELKANEQAAPESIGPVLKLIEAALMRQSVFLSAARPKAFARIIISRYGPGMTYGAHTDNAMIGGMRTDLSFTLAMSPPDAYGGGDLVIEDTDGETRIRPDAGDAYLYPSTTLHRVEPVTSGERLAAVGWVRSYIRRADQREILFDLDRVIRQNRQDGADSNALDLLLKTRSNLIRMWTED